MMRIIRSIIDWVVVTMGEIRWKYNNGLTSEQHDKIRSMLTDDYYIILTRRNNHLSTFFVGLASFVLTGKWSHWAHALMNLENEVSKDSDFRLVEATGNGVHYSEFKDVFKVHSVVLLKPKSMSVEHWTAVMDRARTHLGKPYDSLFDLKNDERLSCVELVRSALMAEPNYEVDFAEFESMIRKNKNLTPQMFYDCPDFGIAYEIRRR